MNLYEYVLFVKYNTLFYIFHAGLKSMLFSNPAENFQVIFKHYIILQGILWLATIVDFCDFCVYNLFVDMEFFNVYE